MDLHRAAFKMENSSYLPNPLASPALMVLASTAEASRDASIPCQQPRPFGVPVSVDKDVHIPFTNGSYTFASMYHRQSGVPGTFANRDFPPSLLHLHPQFAPPNLDCSPISMLNHSGVGAFRPFASTEDRESYQSAFTPAKRLKNCHDTESPHLRFSDADGKEYDFGAQLPSGSPSSLKVDDTGKKIFAVSGLISDRETSSSPEDRNDRSSPNDGWIVSAWERPRTEQEEGLAGQTEVGGGAGEKMAWIGQGWVGRGQLTFTGLCISRELVR
uniref:Ring finger protein 220 n=1 Tax=Sarcophilus harrisii TaxID=9305 RepID=G3WJZ8_SARHA